MSQQKVCEHAEAYRGLDESLFGLEDEMRRHIDPEVLLFHEAIELNPGLINMVRENDPDEPGILFGIVEKPKGLDVQNINFHNVYPPTAENLGRSDSSKHMMLLLSLDDSGSCLEPCAVGEFEGIEKQISSVEIL
jgi:hypothetical protein